MLSKKNRYICKYSLYLTVVLHQTSYYNTTNFTKAYFYVKVKKS